MIVTDEHATVHRAAGRRWFTKRAAYLAAARAKIRARCDCEPSYCDDYTTGYKAIPCRWHEDMDRCAALVRRLARWYRHVDEKEASE